MGAHSTVGIQDLYKISLVLAATLLKACLGSPAIFWGHIHMVSKASGLCRLFCFVLRHGLIM